MSFHGKMQQLKSGQADKEIQLWAYEQIEKEPKEPDIKDIIKILKDLKIDINPDTIQDWENGYNAALKHALTQIKSKYENKL